MFLFNNVTLLQNYTAGVQLLVQLPQDLKVSQNDSKKTKNDDDSEITITATLENNVDTFFLVILSFIF